MTSSEQEPRSRSRNGRVRSRSKACNVQQPLQMEDEDTFAVLYSREGTSAARSIDGYSCDGSSSDSCEDDLGDFGPDDKELQELKMRIKKTQEEKAKKRRGSKKSHATKKSEEKEPVQIGSTPEQSADPELVTRGGCSGSSYPTSQRIEDIRRKRERAERELSLAIRLRQELHVIVAILDENTASSETFTSCSQTLDDLQKKVAKLTGRSVSPPRTYLVNTEATPKTILKSVNIL
jgi:hypothetical protein